MGGGTGLARKFWPPDCRYVCLDNDIRKLRVFQADHPGDTAIVSDGTEAGVGTGTIDAVVCKAVAHHLSDGIVDDLVAECRRVLGSEGRLVFLEPLLANHRPASRILWSLDRGSFPRTQEQLVELLERGFELERVVRFSVIHQYLLCVGAPRSRRSPGDRPRN
jgi:SAM-dependent methyltransferase